MNTEDSAESEHRDVLIGASLRDNRTMPKTPDFSRAMVAEKRATPFILDDFKGSWAYRVQKP